MSHIQIRISAEEKEATQEVLEKMGLNFSSSIKLFLRKMVQEQKIPFEISASSPRKAKKIPSQTQQQWTGFSKHKIG